MKNPKFQVFVGRKNRWYFRLMARNGEIILDSKRYTSKAGCLNGIRSVKNNARDDERYVRKMARDGKTYFVLVAGNHKAIGVSERYTTKRRCESGIRAVKRVAAGAPINLPGNGASSTSPPVAVRPPGPAEPRGQQGPHGPAGMRAQISLSKREFENRSLETATIERAARLFSQEGALLITNVFPKEFIQKLQDAFLQQYANKPDDEIRKTCLEVGNKRFMFTIEIRPPFNDPDLYACPLVLPILRTLLGSHCILQSVGVVCSYPGSEMQHLHIDHPPLFEEAVGLNAFFPPYALHVVVPLIDLDEECGTTALWAGSHRLKSPPARAADTLQGASFPWAKMGDCYLMDYRLRHRGMANRSNRPRPILYLVFSRRWFQDRKNYAIQTRLVMDPLEFEKISEEHRLLFETMRPVAR